MRFKRFLGAMLAGILGVVLLSQGVGAQQPTPTSATDTLQVDPVSRPPQELPTPDQPDGTLRLPAEAGAIPGLEVEIDPEAGPSETAAPAEVSREQLLAGLSPEVAKRSQLLMEADRLYRAGAVADAELIYRVVKDPQWLAESTPPLAIAPLVDPAELPPAGQVYWREAQAALDSEFPSRVLVPLDLLTKDYPEFLPGQALYARYLAQQGRADEAIQLLDAAITRYPFYPGLLRAQVEVQMARQRWIEAAITANQFVIFNPDHPDAEAMQALARQNLDRFRGEMNQALTRNLVSNIVTGAAGYILTGGLLGPFSAINSGVLLMQGEVGLGNRIAEQAKQQLPIVQDPTIRAYVNDLGQRLAALAGREEFDYSFEVILDDSLNAFALPGGKIFIHAGAITKSHSEAELAGLLGHEIAHAVLSHGFQMVTQGNLTASLAAFIPIPQVANLTAGLIISGYSRDMERQADILGTKLLATSRYAADGLHNLMLTLEQEYGNRGVSWFASHPNPSDRVAYLRQLVDQGGFNRYAYEGVETHLAMRHRTAQVLSEYERQQATEGNRRPPGRR